MEYIHHYKPSEVNKAQRRGGTLIVGKPKQTICSFLHLCLSSKCFLHEFLLCDAKQIFWNNSVVWSRQPRFHRRHPRHWILNIQNWWMTVLLLETLSPAGQCSDSRCKGIKQYEVLGKCAVTESGEEVQSAPKPWITLLYIYYSTLFGCFVGKTSK